ncbi:MAG: M14 family zinc carboxypeptidase [Planctomycetota bacterium]
MIRYALPMFGLLAAIACADQPIETVAERSNYRATATHADVVAICKQLAEASPQLQLASMGQTMEGREQPLLIISKQGITAADDPRLERPRIFVMANIHAGEVCGKEALLALAREFAEGKHAEILESWVLLFAPIYNADGNERFSTDHRPGQAGPAEGMGQRPNAQGFDLNRDHMKLASPEARHLARLCTVWDPLVLIDTHTTNGSIHAYTITYDGPRHPGTPPELLAFVRDTFLPAVDAQLEANTGYKSFFYGNFSRDGSMWQTYPDQPRFSTHYFGLRGRVGILSEAYSYASYKDRILATKAFVIECLRQATEYRDEIERLTAPTPSTTPLAIRSKLVPLPDKVEVIGNPSVNPYETDGDLTGIAMEKVSLVYNGLSAATEEVAVPVAYAIPPQLVNVLQNLTAHGVQLYQLAEATTAELRISRVNVIARDERPFQGHRRLRLQVEPRIQTQPIPAGWFVAQADQPLGRLLVHLLEPTADDGLASWNFLEPWLMDGADYPVHGVLYPQQLPLVPAELSTQRTIAWQPQTSGVDASLRGLSVPSAEVAWASGTGGTVIRTEDGGTTWQEVGVEAARECDFRDIAAFNAREAVVISAGTPARVYRTEDGGQSWVQAYAHEDPRVFFDAFAFWTPERGIAFSDPLDGRLFLIQTKDGGRTWTELPVKQRPEVLEGEAGFAGSGTCLAVTGDQEVLIGLGGAIPSGQARVLRSSDGGETWTAVETPLKADEGAGVFSLAFANPSHGVAVGGNYLQPDDHTANLAITRDGGVSWYRPTGDPPAGYRSAVAAIRHADQITFIAVGADGCDYSVDLGESWRPFGERGFHAVATAPDGTAVWFVGADGSVAKWRPGD